MREAVRAMAWRAHPFGIVTLLVVLDSIPMSATMSRLGVIHRGCEPRERGLDAAREIVDSDAVLTVRVRGERVMPGHVREGQELETDHPEGDGERSPDTLAVRFRHRTH